MVRTRRATGTVVRLLMVSNTFPPVVGGLQTYALEVARGLAARCDAFAVAAPYTRGAFAHDRTLPFRVHRFVEAGEGLALSGIVPIATLARLGAFEVAFATHWAAAHAVLRAGRPRAVFTAAHGKELLIRPLARVPIAQRGYDSLRRRVLERSTGFFPVSSYTAGLLEQAGVEPARIVTVHNGVDPERFRPFDASALRAELGAIDRPVLLTVARLVPRKGIDTVLASLPRVLRDVPNALYVVAGDGPDRPRLERLAREHGVSASVRFLGAVPGDIARYYNACDVFVMPARVEPEDVEGFGLVFLEAGACAKPVVGARAGGAVDAIVEGRTGLLVPPDDPAALASALSGLLRDEARRVAMGREGRTHVLADGTWDRAVDRIYAAIARLTASARRGGTGRRGGP